MTLTEQWKKGELESGFYYVYLKHLEMFDIAGSSTLYGILERGNENSIEILASVPSYEEWRDTENRSLLTTEFSNEIDELNEENQQLKTLLKEWMHFYPIILYEHEDTLKTKDIIELFDKTREVLK